MQPLPRDLDQHRELDLVAGRAHVLHDPTHPGPLLHDLHRGRTRSRLHLPDEPRHPTGYRLVPRNEPTHPPDLHEYITDPNYLCKSGPRTHDSHYSVPVRDRTQQGTTRRRITSVYATEPAWSRQLCSGA